jgi:heat-inducible transcriptional repressor
MVTERQNNILKMIVEEYIKTARPVGSKAICDALDCSSATVRNEMVALEEIGYIEKTHTSSGRIPSEKGYHYYIDTLMQPKEMTGEDMLKLERVFRNKSLQLDDAITRSMEIISELTNYTSVVLGESASTHRLKQVEVVPVNEDHVIAIVITDKGSVEHRQMTVKNVSLDEIKKVVDLINTLIVGTPIDEVCTKLEFEIKPIIGKYIKQHETIYNAFYNVLNEFSIKNNVHVAGRNKILDQPEFEDPNRIKKLINKFEDQDLIKNIEEKSNDINIYIGKESNIDEDVTVIKTRYKVDGEEGTIAIIGPKRMEYNRVISLLEYIKENIER